MQKNLDLHQKIARIDDLERRSKFIQRLMLALLIVVIAVPVIGAFWLAQFSTEVSSVTISDMQVVGSSVLCPGDTLHMSYTFKANGEGILDLDRTIWSFSPPPKTIIFSDSQRFVLVGSLDETINEEWHVPKIYYNANLEKELPLASGEYLRILAVSSPSRSSILTVASVPFKIRSDCGDY